MPKFAIAFVLPSDKCQLKHTLLEATDKESALKLFFDNELSVFYSNDEYGYHYFQEDFFDQENPSGSILSIE